MKFNKQKIRNPNNIFILDIVDYLVPMFNLSSVARAVYVPTLIETRRLLYFFILFIGYVLFFQLPDAVQGGLPYIIQTIIFFFKILFFLISIKLVDFKNENKNLNKVITIILLVNIGLSAVGIGYTQYGYSSSGLPYGVKGVYKGGNELSITYLIFVILAPINRLSHSLLLAIMGLTFATKVALLGAVYVLAKAFIVRMTINRILLAAFIIIPVTALLLSYYIEFQNERWADNARKSVGLVNLILSGRDEKLAYALQSHDATFSSILIGHGFYTYQYSTPNYKEFFVEIDSVDLFLSGGLIGVLLVYLPIFYKFYRAIIEKELKWVIALFVMLVLSTTSGHVVYNSLLPLLLLSYKK